jgi:hypothetical protein
VGANGKIDPVWGRRRQIVSFAGHDFEFDFFLAVVATPIIGMDFLAKFEISIIPANQQVLHAASGCTLTKASTSSSVSPWSPETAATALPPQVQKDLEEFPPLLRPSAALPSHSTALSITTTQVARSFSPWKKQVLFATQICLGRPLCTWSPRKTGRGAPAATTAA